MIRLENGDPRWLQFVSACPQAMPFHHPSWAALLSECYGYPAFVMVLPEASGGVAAGVAVLEIRRAFGGRRWVALPFTDRYEPLLGPDITPSELVTAVERQRRSERIASVEVRGALSGADASTRVRGLQHTLSLVPDLAAIEQGFTESQVRRNIVKARREGVVVRRAESREGLVRDFYELHLRTRARQGVPVQPRRFFRLLWDRMLEPGLGFCLLAYHGQLPIAGAVFLAWNRSVTYKFGASDRSHLGLRPNHLVFWEAISWAAQNGYQAFDFGRTDLDNQGLRRFKSSWGAVEKPLVYARLGSVGNGALTERLSGALAFCIRRSPPGVCRLVGEALYKYAA